MRDKQAIKEQFMEMTKDLMQQTMEYSDVSDVSPEVLREIRENVKEILSMN